MFIARTTEEQPSSVGAACKPMASTYTHFQTDRMTPSLTCRSYRSLAGWGMDFAINMSRLTALSRFSARFQQSQMTSNIGWLCCKAGWDSQPTVYGEPMTRLWPEERRGY